MNLLKYKWENFTTWIYNLSGKSDIVVQHIVASSQSVPEIQDEVLTITVYATGGCIFFILVEQTYIGFLINLACYFFHIGLFFLSLDAHLFYYPRNWETRNTYCAHARAHTHTYTYKAYIRWNIRWNLSPRLSVEIALGVRLILIPSVSAHPVDNSGVIVINVDGDVGFFIDFCSFSFFGSYFKSSCIYIITLYMWSNTKTTDCNRLILLEA